MLKYTFIHVNIRSMNSNVETLHDLLLNCSNSFNIIKFTETWSTNKDLKDNSNFHLPNFNFIHQEGKTGVFNDIRFKIIIDFSVSDAYNECVIVEIENRKSYKKLITYCFRPPGGAKRT